MILLRNIFGYGILILLQKASIFLLMPFVIASLSVEDFGKASQVLYIGNLCILFVIFGTDEALAKRASHSKADYGSLLTNGYVLLLLASSIFVLFSYFLSDLLYNYFTTNLRPRDRYISIITVAISPIVISALKILRVTGEYPAFARLTIIQVAVQAASIMTFVVWIDGGMTGYLASYLLALAAALLYVLAVHRTHINLNFVSRKSIIDLLSYGAKIAPHTIASWGLYGFTLVFIGKQLGAESAAMLAASNYIPYMANVVSYALLYSFQESLYKKLGCKMQIRTLLPFFFGYVAAFFLIVIIMYAMSAKIFSIIFDSRYALNDKLILLLFAAVFCQFCDSMFQYVLYYMERATQYTAVSTVAAVVFNVVGLVLAARTLSIEYMVGVYALSQFLLLCIRTMLGIGFYMRFQSEI
jgi:O-antigen/teichoic acid export membrane protein